MFPFTPDDQGSLRTSLYGELVGLTVRLRWLLLLVVALWFYLSRDGAGAAAWWALGAVVLYSGTLTGLYRRDRHPPLLAAGLLDLGAIVLLLALHPPASQHAYLAFVLVILTLTLGYGRRGMILSLVAYAVGEAAVQVIGGISNVDVTTVALRAGFLGLVGVVMAAPVARYESIRRRLSRVMIHDRVTGLHNRQYFAESLEQLHKLAVRGGWPYSVVVIDVEGLERVNREQGWAAGDRLLRLLGNQARSAVRSTDLVARTGAAEFTIVLPETSLPDAEHVARKVREGMLESAEGVELAVGVADLQPSRLDAFEDCLHKAYGAVAEARRSDGDRVVSVRGTSEHEETAP